MRAREWSLLVLLSILWGGSFFFAKVALAELGPFTVVFFRVGLAALALNVVASAVGQSLWRAGTPWRQLVVMGALNNALPFSLIFWGQTTITSGLASILNATTPLFTVLVAHALTRDERMTVRKLFGVLAGLAGVAILIGPDLGGSILPPPSPTPSPASTDDASRLWACSPCRPPPASSRRAPY